jgi:hypothetical protein
MSHPKLTSRVVYPTENEQKGEGEKKSRVSEGEAKKR